MNPEASYGMAPAGTLIVADSRGVYRSATQGEIVEAAERILLRSLQERMALDSAPIVKQYLRTWIGKLEHEAFVVLFLDAQHRLIERVLMFRGTINQTSVHPREIAKRCLALNAAAVIVAHNHPSGSSVPSRADEVITQTLKAALALIDVRLLDHIVVTAAETTSMAERGLV